MNNKLTMEQVNEMAKQLDEVVANTDLEKIAQFPSNQGQEETNPEEREPGESKVVNVEIDPNSGEHKIIDTTESDIDEETFEEMFERIQNSNEEVELDPISENELKNYISNVDKTSIINEIAPNFDISNESLKVVLSIANKKIKNEEVDVYKSFPDEVKNMINKYISTELQIQINSPTGKQVRNMVADQLISEFVTNISMDKITTDFNKEIEDLFTKGSQELADSIVGYTEERNKKYREYAEKMEDPEKKEKVLKVLDQIDEAYNLTNLKEFAKRCKIKKIELGRPDKVYSSINNKYKNSTYNIYDINLAAPILFRNINAEKEEYSDKDIHAFFICFVKQTLNMHPENVLDHSYMYYVIYNIVLMDMNKGNSKYVSDKFLENIKEVIENLRMRNNNFE